MSTQRGHRTRVDRCWCKTTFTESVSSKQREQWTRLERRGSETPDRRLFRKLPTPFSLSGCRVQGQGASLCWGRSAGLRSHLILPGGRGVLGCRGPERAGGLPAHSFMDAAEPWMSWAASWVTPTAVQRSNDFPLREVQADFSELGHCLVFLHRTLDISA